MVRISINIEATFMFQPTARVDGLLSLQVPLRLFPSYIRPIPSPVFKVLAFWLLAWDSVRRMIQ